MMNEIFGRIEKLHKEVEEAIRDYEAIVCVERLESIKRRIEEEYKREVEKERDARLFDSVARLATFAAGQFLGNENLIEASQKELPYGSVVIVEKNGEFEVVNLSRIAREKGVDPDLVFFDLLSTGRVLTLDLFRSVIEERERRCWR